MEVYLSLFVGPFGLVMYLALMGEVGALKANVTTYLTPSSPSRSGGYYWASASSS